MKTPYNLGTQTAPTPSTSLDLPPSLEALISQEISSPMQPPMTGLSGALTGMGSYMPMQQGAVPSFQEGGMVGPGGMPIRPQPEMPEFGVPRRENLYPGEDKFFKENPNVAGMAAEDNTVILNPYSSNSAAEQQAVALNEAARVYMRNGDRRPTYQLTPEQRAQFANTPYAADEQAMRETIAARILSGDPSARNVTPEQRAYVDRILSPAMTPSFRRPSFQEGGMVGPGGMPIRPQPEMPAFGMPTTGGPGLAAPGAMSGQAITPAQVMSEAQKFVKQNPQQYQQTQELIQAAINEGEITLEELNFMVQFAVAATQNPEMYPQLRASVISQGMADEEDLPPEYDPGFMFVLIVMGQSLQGMAQQAPSLEQVMGPPTAPQGVPGLRPSMRLGGPLPERSSNPDGTIPINAHEGEYVIPADVVRRLGTKHFDDLIAKTNEPQKQNTPQRS